MLPFLYVSPVNMAAHLRFLLIDQPLKSLKTSHSFVSLIRSTTKVNTNTPWNNDDERLQCFFLPEWFLCLHHQTGYDIQQAQEDSSRPAVPADPGVREDEGLSSHGAGAEFRWEPSAL